MYRNGIIKGVIPPSPLMSLMSNGYVIVVMAWESSGTRTILKECKVFEDDNVNEEAHTLYRKWQEIYGGENVALASRQLIQ